MSKKLSNIETSDKFGSNVIQPIDDIFSTDGHLEEFARIDHQHPLSNSFRSYINKNSRRNILHNGEQELSQRYGTNTASVAVPAAGGFFTDRWQFIPPNIATSVIYPSYNNFLYEDFRTSVILDAGSASHSMGAAELSIYRQGIEGKNIQHLRWGTTKALPLVFSFYVPSITVAQVIIIEFYYTTATQQISRSINVIGSGRYFVTIPGHTGTIPSDSYDEVLGINIWVAAGSNYSGGASLQTDWGNTANKRAFGCGNFYAAANRQIYITGMQLEIGTVPTPYEHQQINEAVQDCQRYAYFPLSELANASYGHLGTGWATATAKAFTVIDFPVTMRAIPSITLGGVAAGNYYLFDRVAAAFPAGNINVDILVNRNSGGLLIDAEGPVLTVYRSYQLGKLNGVAGNFGWLAEI